MIKTIELTVAERQVINMLLSSCGSATVDIARKARAVRKDLKLKGAEKTADALNEQLRTQGRGATWEDLLDLDYQETFTLAEEHLRWIQELLLQKDWAKDRESVPVAQLVVIADLADTITDALSRET